MATSNQPRRCVTCSREFYTHSDDNHAMCFACRQCDRINPCSTCDAWSPGRWDTHLQFLARPPPAPAATSPTPSSLPLGSHTQGLADDQAPERGRSKSRSRRKRRRSSSSEFSSDTSGDRRRRRRHTDRDPADFSQAMTTLIEGLKDWTKSTLEGFKASITPTQVTQPQPPPPALPRQVPSPPTLLPESVSLYASDHDWDEGGEFESLTPEEESPPDLQRETTPTEVTSLDTEAPAPTLTASSSLLTGTPQNIVPPTDAELFPLPPVLPPSGISDLLPSTLQTIEATLHLGIRVPPAPEVPQASKRRLITHPEPQKEVNPEFPIDASIKHRYLRFARGAPKDWTAYNQELNKAVRTDENSFNDLLRCPEIPQAVKSLLCNPPQGRAQASTTTRGFSLHNNAAQKREEALRATDRATRTTFKFQALVQWAADAIQQITERSSVASQVLPLLQLIAELTDATVDQLSRASTRLTRQRRENLFPMMGLTEQTVDDLRRLPCEGPDLFAGHFEHVLARQAGQQNSLRRNLRMMDKASPRGRSSRARPRGKPRGTSQRRFRGRSQTGPGPRSSARSSATPGVSVTSFASGRRVASYATRRKTPTVTKRV